VRPNINWDTSSGTWVGIWGYDWPNLLGNAVLSQSSEFEYEVWQPDLRADKIYSHIFENGLIHRLFPARHKKKIYGFKVINELCCRSILDELKNKTANKDMIVHLNGELSSFNGNILEDIEHVPIVFSFLGEINLPLTNLFSFTLNLPSKINLLLKHIRIKHNIKKIKYLTYCNDKHLKHLNAIYKGRKEKLTMGCDFSFWHKLDKITCRQELNLPLNQFIFVTPARLVSLKQIDKFIEVLIKITHKYNFLYLVIGKGTESSEQYLKKLAEPLLNSGRIKFLKCYEKRILLKYLNSADLFVTTSRSEGASVAVMEAFACELPVFSTKTGQTAELMEREQIGCLVAINDPKEWQDKLINILENRKLPKILNRDLAKEYYDWDNIAKRYINIYLELIR
jgi:glycosyltransferase involved in cell wall biosynthesis